MPIYEYKRPNGTTFEVTQSFSEDALTHDPETGVEVQRVLHAPAVHFKGKGFYNTDYGTRNRQRENAAAAESSSSKDSSSSSSESKSEGGSDSKSSAAESKPKAEKADKSASSAGSSAKGDAKPAAAKK